MKKKSRLYNFSEWILTSGKAFSIVITMGHIVTLILFFVLFILSLIKWGLISRVIFGAVFLLSLRNIYRMYKLRTVELSTSIDDIVFNNKIKGGK